MLIESRLGEEQLLNFTLMWAGAMNKDFLNALLQRTGRIKEAHPKYRRKSQVWLKSHRTAEASILLLLHMYSWEDGISSAFAYTQ